MRLVRETLGPIVTRRGQSDGYQGIASLLIVGPEAIVQLPFLPSRREKGEQRAKQPVDPTAVLMDE